MTKVKYNFSLTGFIISLVVIGLLASTFGLFMGEMKSEYGLTGNSTFDSYNKLDNLTLYAEQIQSQTDINQKEGFLDIVGAYFMNGYKALKTAWDSWSVFSSIMSDATMDIPILGHVNAFITTIFLLIIFIGIGVSVLVKMRI